MPSILTYAAAALAAATPLVSAQTYTTCNPLDKTCPPDNGSTQSKLSFDFTQPSALNMWKNVGTGVVTASPNGAQFTLAQRGQAPTIETDFYIFFGEISVTMQAGPGQGIVSSIVLESDDLDEVDWETLGGDDTQIETNYFGKGDTSTYNRFTWASVSSPQSTFHTYTITWTENAITWLIDGRVVRTLPYAAAQGGSRYPQTPMRVRLGIWAGGDPSNAPGTIQWAGGPTDYSQAPFTMYIKSVDIVNYNPAQSYVYGDNSGSWQSILINGASSGGSSPATGSNKGVMTSSSSSTTSSTTTSSSATSSKTTSSETTSSETTSSKTTTMKVKPTHTSTTETSTTSTPTPSSTGSSSSSAAGSSSAAPSSSTAAGSSSGAASSTGSGATSSPSATPTTFNAAGRLAANSLGLISFIALVTAFLQL